MFVLEPLIVLTVLNCIFMFSSTVTTCALWWQYQGHRCCAKKTTSQQRSNLKRSKSYILRTAKKPGKSDFNGYVDVNVVDKTSKNGGREHKNKISKKSVKYLTEYKKKSGEKMLFPNGLEERKLEEKTRMSEASQTINDTKSVVMEFSTVQKVQILDKDSDINPARSLFKDIVIQKDTADKKRDCNVERNFETNIVTAENS